MALDTGRGKIYDGLKSLRADWDSVQRVWNDPVRRDFEENFWKELEVQVDATLRGTDRLSQVLIQMKRDCE
ncbi:MAG: hypothetical protein AB7K24_26865 [Gemmataceae bacterium]